MDAEALLSKYKSYQSTRSNWEPLWQEISDYIMPRRCDFSVSNTQGQKRNRKIIDSHPVSCCEELASALQGWLTPPSSPWFELTADDRPLMQNIQIRNWIKKCADVLIDIFQTPKYKFYPQLHEVYLDLAAYGTAILNVEEDVDGLDFVFSSIFLSNCYIDIDAFGTVDTMIREIKYSPRQMLQKFENDLTDEQIKKLGKKVAENSTEDSLILHIVLPRDKKKVDEDSLNAKKRPFASYYVWVEENHIIRESGFYEFPYMVPRWYVLSGETYGRSQGMTALPDAKMLHKIATTTMKASEKQIDPPLQVPDDGFMAPINVTPGAINYYRTIGGFDTTDLIRPINFGGNINVGLENENQKRQSISKIFLLDLLQDEKKVEMTATEVMQREEARMRIMTPQLGRLHSELLGPLIQRVFNICSRKKLLPDPPKELEGKSIIIRYVSPLARAQRTAEISKVTRLGQELVQYANIKPEVLDYLNFDGVAKWLIDIYNTPPEVVASEKEVQNKRQQRQQQEEQMQQMQQLQVGAEAVKNVAPTLSAGVRKQ